MEVEHRLGILGEFSKEKREQFYKERICSSTNDHQATQVPRVQAVEFWQSMEQCTKILDVACHDGFNSRFLADEDSVELIDGIDLCSAAIEQARLLGKTKKHSEKFNYWECSWEDFEKVSGRPKASYDLVICFEFLEHLPFEEDIKLLQFIDSYLVPGGRVLISTPEINGKWGLRNDLEREHISLMDAAMLCALVHQSIGVMPEIEHDSRSDLLMATWVKK